MTEKDALFYAKRQSKQDMTVRFVGEWKEGFSVTAAHPGTYTFSGKFIALFDNGKRIHS